MTKLKNKFWKTVKINPGSKCTNYFRYINETNQFEYDCICGYLF